MRYSVYLMKIHPEVAVMKWWLILLSVIGAGALTGAGSGQLKPAPPAILARPPLNIGLSVADAEFFYAPNSDSAADHR